MESGGEGNGCSSQTGLGYPTDAKCEGGDDGGGVDGHHGVQQQQRHSKRHVTFSGDEEQRTRAHDKVLRSHTRRANNNGSGLVVTPVVEVSPPKQALRQRATSVTKRGLTWKEDEHSGLSSSEEGDRRKRGGEPEWSGSRGTVIPSSSTCSPPTNETVELGEQAGLGGTTTTLSKAGSGAGSAATTSTRTRRTSGGRRRSRRGEHCSQPDVVATQSNTTTNTTITITTSSSNNRSPSPKVMSSVVGGADAESGRGISEECCDEPETMCQEDDTPAPHHHPRSELPAQPSASNSPKFFASSIVSEGAAPACARSGTGPNLSHPGNSNNNNKPLPREQDAETEETPSMQTVVKVENENCDGATVEGESEISRGGQHRASVEGRRSLSKSGQLPVTGFTSGRGQLGGGVIHKAQKNCEKWNVEDGRGGEQRSKNHENLEEPHPQSICDNVSMPLLKIGNAGKEGASEVCVPAPLPTSLACSATTVKLANSAASTSTRNLRKTGDGSSTSQKKQGGGGKSSSGRSEVSGNRASVTEKKKIVTTPAPMLLMNNLPYMGELTFDTRPRRGRKPKKADICHLISKNYGIHFPVAYLNLAAAAAAAPTTFPPPAIPSHLTGGHVPSTKSSQRRANNGNANVNCTPAISLVGPSPAPAFSNKDVSIVPIIPSSWSPPGGRTQEKVSISGKNIAKPLSLAQQLSMLRPVSSSQQAISMFPIPTATSTSSHSRGPPPYKSEEEEDEDDNCGGDGLYQNRMEDDGQDEGKGNQDGPLNLCMRDGRYKTFPVPISGGKREVDERSTLDVRWRKSTRTLDQAQFGSSSFSSTVQLGASKRNVPMAIPQEGEGMVRKACKSAKLSGTQASSSNSNSTNSYRNSYRSNSSSVGTSVNNLVRIEPIPNISLGSSPSSMMEQVGRGLHSSANFSVAQRLHGRELMGGGSGNGGGAISPYGVASPTIGGKSGKQQGSSRKKREVGLRGDIKISPCNPEASAGGSTSAAGSSAGPGPSGFSSFGGGTLFGQSTSGINDGAEVSICKFKFTGGAKPCLQEKKMLSVDSGGNFRFYTDKAAGGPASKVGKGQQTPSTSATVTSYSASGNTYSGSGLAGGEFSGDGTGTECHFPLSSLPKSAKSMSMCMPYAGNNPGVSTITSAASKATTNLSSSTASSVGLPLPIPITPTAEELQQLHLSINHAGQQSARGSSPSLGGEYSYSSSNSCSSSDNSNENLAGDGTKMEVSPKSRFTSHTGGTYHRHGTGGKLKRKRRTRKSLMREKLEKTFKEKGFLIQTQQLESAEGATYCKFRQLRKFTRYLFRSWKDYLPDHVKDISDKSGNNGNSNGENLPGSSQAALQQQSPPSSDVKREITEESTQIGDVEEDEDMDSSDKEDTNNEDHRGEPEPSLISEKIRVAGGSASTDEDENGEEEDQVVLIEASRSQPQPKSGQSPPPPRQPQAHSSLSTGSNQMGDDEASDEEEEEELQVDS